MSAPEDMNDPDYRLNLTMNDTRQSFFPQAQDLAASVGETVHRRAVHVDRRRIATRLRNAQVRIGGLRPFYLRVLARIRNVLLRREWRCSFD